MAEHDSPPFARYLNTIQAQLRDLSPEQRERVLMELQTHLEDAAAHAGADPHDPAFQADLIRRLGPSEQLGRALAGVYRSSAARYDRWVQLIGGGAALFSGLLVLAAAPIGYLLRDGSSIVNILTGAPVALIPTILVLHIIYRPLRPRGSWWALACGMLGMIPYFIVSVYHDMLVLLALHDTALHRAIDALNAYPLASASTFGLIGIWFILIGRLSSLTQVPAMPQYRPLSFVAGGSILLFLLSGQLYLGVMIINGSVAPSLQSAFSLLMLMIGFVWITSHLAWSAVTAIWLLQRPPDAPAQLA